MAHGSAPAQCLVTAFDAAYMPFGAALLASLAASRPEGAHVVVWVLHPGDLGEQDRTALERVARGLEVRWSPVDPALAARCGLTLTGTLGGAAYLRCLTPDLVDAPAGRAVYLDADTLVLDDLSPLFSVPLGGRPVGAVLDWLPSIGDAVAPWADLALDPAAPYFNSGVMVMDLEAWRAEDAGCAVLRRCLADTEHLLAQGRWPQNDQYGLNVVFHRRWAGLAPRWNHFSERAADESPAVVHYVGNGKPWSPKCRPEFAARFRATLAGTPWAGWSGPRA